MKSLILIMGILLVCGKAHADIYMKQKHHQDGMTMMGHQEPAKDYIEEMWITPAGMRGDNPENSFIIIPEDRKMIMINHKDKKYGEMPLDMNEMMAKNMQMQGEDPAEMAAFQAMMGNMMKMDISVQSTNETKKINKWNCRKYNMTINNFSGTVSNEIWATEDIQIDKKLYSQFASSKMMLMPGTQEAMASMEEEMKKIKGVQVLIVSTNTVMDQSITSNTELLEYREAKAPANLFQIPKDYVKETGDMPGQPPKTMKQPDPRKEDPGAFDSPDEKMPSIPVDGKQLLKSIFNNL